MKTSDTVVWLASLMVLLAVVAAGVGEFYQGSGSPFAFTSVRGETVQVYGQGLYQYDSQLGAVGNKVGDAVILALSIPVLIVAIVLYRRGSLRGGLLLSGAMAYFLYVYGSLAFGAAYNTLFLVYIALFSLSLYGLILCLASFDIPSLPSSFSDRLPRRGIGAYLIVSGIVLLCVWFFMSILPALLAGQVPPEVGLYTTVITFVIDMGIIGPALIVTGRLILRRAPLGYLLAPTLLVFTVLLGIQLAAMGIVQFASGLFGVGQFIGMVVSFIILTLFAIWFTIAFFKDYTQERARPAVAQQAAQA